MVCATAHDALSPLWPVQQVANSHATAVAEPLTQALRFQAWSRAVSAKSPVRNRTNKGRLREETEQGVGWGRRAFAAPSPLGGQGPDRPHRASPRGMTGRRRQAREMFSTSGKTNFQRTLDSEP
jgi:hypothetical protein